MDLSLLPKDLGNMINGMVHQLEFTEKFNKVLDEFNKIELYMNVDSYNNPHIVYVNGKLPRSKWNMSIPYLHTRLMMLSWFDFYKGIVISEKLKLFRILHYRVGIIRGIGVKQFLHFWSTFDKPISSDIYQDPLIALYETNRLLA